MSDSPSPLEIVQRMYVAFAARDRDGILALFDPDIEWIQNDGFPDGGRHVGATAVLDGVFARFRSEWHSWTARVDEWIDGGATIIAIGEYAGTYRATGASMTAAFAHVYDVADGRITRFRQYTDTARIAAAMGAVATSAEDA